MDECGGACVEGRAHPSCGRLDRSIGGMLWWNRLPWGGDARFACTASWQVQLQSTVQCVSTVDVGGEVDSLLLEAGFLFVGIKTPANQGQIKAWNMSTNQETVLEGHTVSLGGHEEGRDSGGSGAGDRSAALGLFEYGRGDEKRAEEGDCCCVYATVVVDVQSFVPGPSQFAQIQLLACLASSAAARHAHATAQIENSELPQTPHPPLDPEPTLGAPLPTLSQGQVLSLAAAGGMLFSGAQDATIRVWKPSPLAGFECSAVLRADGGGHSSPVSCLCASGPYLFSADFKGNIKAREWHVGVGGWRGFPCPVPGEWCVRGRQADVGQLPGPML